jgi:predicted nucleic acid-binding protein
MISVGIDVSKEKSMVCAMRPYGELLIEPYEIPHTEQSLGMLARQLASFAEETRVVMEATSTYSLPVLARLKDEGIHVSVINPLVMKKYATRNIRKGKTDKLDALKIANYGIDNWYHLVDFQASTAVYEELKILGRQYAHYIQIKIKSMLGMTSILDRTMPGIKHHFKWGQADYPGKDKLVDFVEMYWHYDTITSMSETEFAESYARWTRERGYRFNIVKAQSIYAMAKDGIPTLPSSTASTKMLVQEAVRVLREVTRTVESILAQMQVLAKGLKEYGVVRASLAEAGRPIGPNDLHIAASALAHDLTLVTHNVREFSRVAGLMIEDWEQTAQ